MFLKFSIFIIDLLETQSTYNVNVSFSRLTISWPYFSGNKIFCHHLGANSKKFGLILPTFFLLSFSHFFAKKTLKKQISTSIWSAQHPIKCLNIHQIYEVTVKIEESYWKVLHYLILYCFFSSFWSSWSVLYQSLFMFNAWQNTN